MGVGINEEVRKFFKTQWFEEEILFDMSKSREAEVFRVAITFLKQQSVESNAFF